MERANIFCLLFSLQSKSLEVRATYLFHKIFIIGVMQTVFYALLNFLELYDSVFVS